MACHRGDLGEPGDERNGGARRGGVDCVQYTVKLLRCIPPHIGGDVNEHDVRVGGHASVHAPREVACSYSVPRVYDHVWC